MKDHLTLSRTSCNSPDVHDPVVVSSSEFRSLHPPTSVIKQPAATHAATLARKIQSLDKPECCIGPSVSQYREAAFQHRKRESESLLQTDIIGAVKIPGSFGILEKS